MCEAKKLYENGINKRTIKKKCNYESFQELYDEIFEIDKEFYKNIKFLSFNRGYSNKIKQSFNIDNLNDLLKYKKYILLDNGNIDTNYLNNISFSPKEIYDIFYGCTLCEKCSSETRYISFKQGYNTHCKKCRQHLGGLKAREKSIITNLQRYGYENAMGNIDIVNKKKETCKLLYGDENYNNPDKAKETMLDKYGDIYQRTDSFHVKRESTCLEKYGVLNVLQSSEAKAKTIITKLEKYGVEHHMKSIDFINNVYIPSMIEKYGGFIYISSSRDKT